MKISGRKLVAFAGLAALLVTVQVAASLRSGDWGEMLDLEGWLWALTPSVFMGAWGWIVLLVGRGCDSRGASTGLIGLAVLYFAITTWFTADIILNGNSTAGLAFFFFPIVATVVMVPLIVLVLWLGPKMDEEPS